VHVLRQLPTGLPETGAEATKLSKFNPHDTAHWAAQHLDIPVNQAKKLYAEGKISGTRNLPVREWDDRPWLAAMEQARPQFDTPLAPFISDLRTWLIPRLRVGFDEDAPQHRRFADFLFFAAGVRGENAYPVDQYRRAWRGHRVGVSLTQLVAAGDYVYADQLAQRAEFLERLCEGLELLS
jgi:hypothetical protein